MPEYNLSDAQWCMLDLLMRARQKGVARLNRLEVLNSPSLPDAAKLKLTWGALVMPKDLVTWHGQHDFSITDAGVSLYNLKFGTRDGPPAPSAIADEVIYLPGPKHGARLADHERDD